jgi:hypothetical protein
MRRTIAQHQLPIWPYENCFSDTYCFRDALFSYTNYFSIGLTQKVAKLTRTLFLGAVCTVASLVYILLDDYWH